MHIVLIHGKWLTGASFELFRAFYEARGHGCIAPRTDQYVAEILRLEEPPVLIGHSSGGVIVQQLLDRGLGTAGVAIAPTPQRSALTRHTVRWNNRDRAPLLLVGGAQDRIVTPSMMKQTCDEQRRTSPLTELRMFPGRSHLLCLEPGWEEVARSVIDWASEHAGRSQAQLRAS